MKNLTFEDLTTTGLITLLGETATMQRNVSHLCLMCDFGSHDAKEILIKLTNFKFFNNFACQNLKKVIWLQVHDFSSTLFIAYPPF